MRNSKNLKTMNCSIFQNPPSPYKTTNGWFSIDNIFVLFMSKLSYRTEKLYSF